MPVSDLCDEPGLQPTVFYRWQKEFFENGAAALTGRSRPDREAEQQRIEFLEKKIQTKDELLAELMAEHIAFKKNLGGALTTVWVPHAVRDLVVDFVRCWLERTEIGIGRFIHWPGVRASERYAKLSQDREFRLMWAGKIGLGSELQGASVGQRGQLLQFRRAV